MSTKTAAVAKSTDYLRTTPQANETDLTLSVVNSVLSIFQLGRETEKAYEAFARTAISLRRLYSTDIKAGTLTGKQGARTVTLSWKAQEGVADLTGRSQGYKSAMERVFKSAVTEIEVLLISEGVKPASALRVANAEMDKIKNSMGLPIRRWLNDNLTATQQAAYGLKWAAQLGSTNKLPETAPAVVAVVKSQGETYRAKLVKLVEGVRVDDTASLLTLAQGILNRAVGTIVPEHKATRAELDAMAALTAALKAIDAKLVPGASNAPSAPQKGTEAPASE